MPPGVSARRPRPGTRPMDLAKGMKFHAVAVMACDDQVIPLQSRIEGAAEESELDELFDSERHLLYVACTRARDHVAITGLEPGSEFLADLLEYCWAGPEEFPQCLLAMCLPGYFRCSGSSRNALKGWWARQGLNL